MKQGLNEVTDLEKISDSDIRSYGNSTGLGLKKHDPESTEALSVHSKQAAH